MTETETDFFRSDEFLGVLRDVFFPRARPEIVECEGRRFRLLVDRASAVSGFWPFPFPVEAVEEEPARRVPHVLDVVECELPVGCPGPVGAQPVPLIRWSGFASFSAFESWAGAAPRHAQFKALRSHERVLGRDFGPVEFLPEDHSVEAFETVIRLKGEQYRRNGFPDRFAGKRREIYEEFRRRGLLTVSSLRAGGQIVAGHIGNRWQGRLLYRLPAYDPAFARYSPGAIHLLHLLRNSYERGDSVFDLLVGGEAYKFQYATHVRWIVPLGREPWRHRVPRVARWRASQMLRRNLVLYRGITRLERTIRGYRP